MTVDNKPPPAGSAAPAEWPAGSRSAAAPLACRDLVNVIADTAPGICQEAAS